MFVLNKENIFVPPRRQVQQADCQAGHAFRSAPPPAWLKYSKTFSQEFLSHCILHSLWPITRVSRINHHHDHHHHYDHDHGICCGQMVGSAFYNSLLWYFIWYCGICRWWGPLVTMAYYDIVFGIVVFANGGVLLLQWLMEPPKIFRRWKSSLGIYLAARASSVILNTQFNNNMANVAILVEFIWDKSKLKQRISRSWSQNSENFNYLVEIDVASLVWWLNCKK